MTCFIIVTLNQFQFSASNMCSPTTLEQTSIKAQFSDQNDQLSFNIQKSIHHLL